MKTQGTKRDVVFLSVVRTGFGKFGGAVKDLSATELGTIAAAAALDRSGLAPSHIDHVVMGNALQTSADAIYLARHVGLQAGVPVDKPAVTVNRLCGSGFESIIQGAQQILLRDSRAVLAGGTESMSQAPHVVRGARWGLRLGASDPFEDSLWEALTDSQCGYSMAETAENLADKHGLTREEVDRFALLSQHRAKTAWEEGVFDDEVVSIRLKDPTSQDLVDWRADEYIRPHTTLEALMALPPYFKEDGFVTAGNASGICDGAAATVIASEEFAEDHELAPIGRLVA